MWLWDPSVPPHWHFHVDGRIRVQPEGEFIPYKDDPARFEKLFAIMASGAVAEIIRRRDRFASFASVASHYADQPTIGWSGYHGGVALGLAGCPEKSAASFDAVAVNAGNSDIAWIAALARSASSLARLVADPVAFEAAIEDQITRTRDGLGLASVPHPLQSIG